jgi:hypothetical protein
VDRRSELDPGKRSTSLNTTGNVPRYVVWHLGRAYSHACVGMKAHIGLDTSLPRYEVVYMYIHILGYEVSSPGRIDLSMKLHTWVWNYIPGYEITYLGMKLPTWVWNYLPGYEITYLCMKNIPRNEKHTTEWKTYHGMKNIPRNEKHTTEWKTYHGMKKTPRYETF